MKIPKVDFVRYPKNKQYKLVWVESIKRWVAIYY